MKTKFSIFLLFFFFIIRLAISAETIDVTIAGTLETSIENQASINKTDIVEIVITGTLNDADIALLKTLSTSNSLRKIDLSEVNLVNNALAAQAFKSSNVEYIALPKTLTSMGTECFHGSKLKSIDIPTTNLTVIPNSCFTWSTSLEEIVIPEGVTTLGSQSLVFCSSLKKLTLPSTLTHIGSNAILGNLNFSPWNVNIPLQEIRANMTTLPTMDGYAVRITSPYNTTCKLYVPAGTEAAYRANIHGNNEYGFGLITNILVDYAMETPVIQSPAPVGYNYSTDKLSFTMSESIERTPGGRIWANWIAGGDSEDAFAVFNWSDDGGLTWTEPKVVIDPHNATLSEARRTIISVLWTDPNGKLWVFFDQSMKYYDGRAGLWAAYCENPDAENPTWSAPKRLWHGMSINKPIVLSTGEWVLPVCLWARAKMSNPYSSQNAYSELDAERKSHALVSTDNGVTWKKRGGVLLTQEHQDFDETHITEKNDGTLWMTARSKDGIYQSFSTDKGYTWSAPSKYMDSAIARHFIRRLSSGNLLLVKNGRINYDDGRKNMTAYLSDDDGATWKGGLILDERSNVTYPDGFQAPDGTIYVAYDVRGIIYHIAAFTESDIMAGEFLSANSMQKGIIAPVLNDVATVHVTTAGGLTDALDQLSINVNFLRDITITGNLNDADIALLKTMSTGANKLRIIDLSGASLTNDALAESAFDGSSIESIKLPASLKMMGVACFNNCMRLQYIDIPTTELTVIPERAFTRCQKLTEFNVPEGVVTIGKNAFTFCASLEELTLPSTLTHIGESAFLGNVNSTFNVPIPLKVINAKMTTVPTMDAHGLCLGAQSDQLWSTCVLKVPMGSLAAYKADKTQSGYWYGFGYIKNIEETTPTNIDSADQAVIPKISLLENKSFAIELNIENEISASIYTASGQLCFTKLLQSERTVFNLPQHGFYVVKVGKETFKIVL